MLEENHFSASFANEDIYAKTSYLPYVDTSSKKSSTEQVSQAAPAPAVLTEIDQLAATYRLGKARKEYKNAVSKHLSAGLTSCMIGIIFFIPLILLALNQGAGYIRGLGLIWMIVTGFGFLYYGINRITVAINNFLANIRDQHARYYLCFYGILYIRGKQVQALRWDEVSALQKVLRSTYSNLVEQYILYPLSNDKEPLVIGKVCIKLRATRLQIEQEINQHLLPKCMAAYKAGQTLKFGPLHVTTQGLSMEGMEAHLPWKLLGSVEERGGRLVIQEKGTLATWTSIDISTMFNVCTLFPLLDQIRRDKRAKELEQQSSSYRVPTNMVLQQSEWQEYE